MKLLSSFSIVFMAIMLLLQTNNLSAQENVTPLSKKERQAVVDSINAKLKGNYVFPKVADQMAESIESKLRKGDYNAIDDPQRFASVLTEDLRAISKDKHIRVSFAPKRISEQQQTVTAADSIAYRNRYIASLKRNNFGFKELKILDGNVGYLDLRGFSNVQYAGETAVAAMNFLSNTDAIIIDLRFNGGGSPEMIQLISSYLFGNEPVHLNNFYWRPTDSNSQTWTLPHVSGKRSPDTPVYVLTSSGTFSAAEEFSYNLKNLKRATLIGETTGGGAHPGGSVIATDRYTIWVPNGRAINPITKTNWEGTGVSPHIKVPASEALDVAHMKALELLISKNTDERLQSYYEWPIAELKVKKNPVSLTAKQLKAFVGAYGPRNITYEHGKLFYQREGRTKFELYPYSNHEFMLVGLDNFRIKFLSEGNKVMALQGLYDNGHSDKSVRSK